MGIQDSQKLQIIRQHGCNISQAVWPANMRKSIATGRIAQHRRAILINSKPYYTLLAKAAHMYLSSTLILVFMCIFIGGIAATSILLHMWYILFTALIVLTIIALLLASPFLMRLYPTFRQLAWQTSHQLRSSPGFPSLYRSPETPMPSAPLIRVLDTVDLSQGDAEHFLEKVEEDPTPAIEENHY